MNIFKNHTYSWWQIGIFKLSLLAIGVAIGAYWQGLFLPHLALLVSVGVVFALYIIYISLRQ
ncbi:hypothetical protein KJ819_03250 [Patescibacteria group bacterium]|nr:hypothetical protein [Patescibacteria group bacterium]MBU1500680.1 hypothetical protein [Patescibacteria group bacterium]MBU2080767.1 hypothetical protein [Patescibacteria group bacterium]MBU2123872.1 hypothetical protein [Patescibacteria group bacterium]MBU2194837.1 hypothetical protein [Patescibacteria group bacterium]